MTDKCTTWPYELPDKLNSIDDILFFVRDSDAITVHNPKEKGSITFSGEAWRDAVGELLARTRFYYGMQLALKSTCEVMQAKIDYYVDLVEDMKHDNPPKHYCLECGSDIS